MEVPPGVEDIVYLDNAATVFPKPAQVLDRALDLYKRFGVNPGRSGYDLCQVGGHLLQETRERAAAFFGADHPERLCFAGNATDALNLLIQGVLAEGDHAVSTILEHNSVLRPLNHLARDNGVSYDLASCGDDGLVDPAEISALIRPETKAVIVNHGSNVIGTLQALEEIGRVCREKGVLFLVDTAQTAGVVPIDVERMGIDALAFTGHKSLLAPTGIGGVWVRDGVDVRPTRFGGTGVKSAYPFHLEEYPFRLEVGTPNLLGVAALHESLEYLSERGLEAIYRHEMELFARLQEGLEGLPGVRVRGTTSLEHRLPVLSLTVEGLDPSDVGTMLDVDHSVAVRTGLQCAPLVHEYLGTAPRGTVRFSVGPMNQASDIEAAVRAMRSITVGVS